MSKKVIMLDLDGTLADFVLGFTTLAHRLFGTRIFSTPQQTTRNFHASGLLTKEQEGEVWRQLRKESCWWETLKPLVPVDTFKRLDVMSQRDEIVYVTSRVSDSAPTGYQTSRWLIDQGLMYPNVLVSSKKGEIARAIGATHAIDDMVENCFAIHWIADLPQTKCYLLNRPYNQIQETPEVGPKIPRVDTVEQFLNEVEND